MPWQTGWFAVKLLMFFTPEFWIKTFRKVLPDVPDHDEESTYHDAVVLFYQIEEADVLREEKVVTKWVKNAKWMAGKFGTRTIVLHSFNHLSESKAPLQTVVAIVEEVRKRLERTGYSVAETPFGYQNEWKMHVSGESLAKVFKDL